MKSIEDIIAVLLSGSILLFSFFYVVNFQAALFSELFENKKKEDELKQEIEEIRQKRLAIEQENEQIETKIRNIKNKYHIKNK